MHSLYFLLYWYMYWYKYIYIYIYMKYAHFFIGVNNLFFDNSSVYFRQDIHNNYC